MTLTTSTIDEVRTAIAAERDTRTEQLGRLVAIPSVSADPSHDDDVVAAARATAELLRGAGLDNVELLDGAGGPDAVYGDHLHAGDDAPTVLLYAHYDVQPHVDADAWTTPPFTPIEQDGRLHGRGAADDKHGVVSIAWAVSALRGVDRLAVNVKVLVEGEEEVGSPHLAPLLAQHGDRLAADVVIVDDGSNIGGRPTLVASLRGLVALTATVTALEGSGLHSGLFGGAVPDPRMALSVLLASLVDETGALTVPGTHDGIVVPDSLAAALVDEPGAVDELREEVGLVDEAPLALDPEQSVAWRTAAEPVLTIIGIDGPDVANASNTISPRARARLSIRLAPGQDPGEMHELVRGHLEAQRPLGLPVTVEAGESAPPFVVDDQHPSFAAALSAMSTAYGRDAAVRGMGGSIPMTAPLQEANPQADILIVGAGDDGSNIHGIDESLPLDDWEANTLAIALLLADADALRSG